jgi:serine/threonine-protein kinase
MTGVGVILGTAAYMAPEQARGKPVDKRADIWAFGCVLFEMLTGQRAFEDEDVSLTLSKVLQREPDWSALPSAVPPRIVELLQRCLKKDPRERLRDIGDARLELHATPVLPSASGVQSRSLRVRMVAFVAPAILVAVALGFVLGRRVARDVAPAGSAGPVGPVARTSIDLPATASLTVGTQVPLIGFESPSLAISPDGRHLVYVGQGEGGTRLYHREMSRFDDPKPLPGTEGALFAFFSPDSAEIGFLTSDRLKKTSVNAGSPTTLCRARTPIRASWLAGDVIYFSEDQGRTLSRVSATRGESTQVFSFPGTGWIDQVLPNGRAALVTSRTTSMSTDYAAVQLLMIDSREVKALALVGYDARYLASGHLMFARAGALMAVPFDVDRLEVTGPEAIVVRDVGMESLFGTVHLAASDTGTLVYVSGGDVARGKVGWVDRRGGRGALSMPDQVYGVFDINPDGHRIAIAVADVDDYVWIWDERSAVGQILASRGNQPRWDFTGERVAFRSGGWFDPSNRIMVQEVRGGTARELISQSASPTDWSRNGIVSLDMSAPRGVTVVSAQAGAQPKSIKAGAGGSGLSSDGRYLSYATDDSGRFEVWVQELDGPFRQQISSDGGVETVWCEKCNELFYRNGNRIFGSRVRFEPTIEFGPPRVVFVADEFVDTPGKSFDVSSDGERLYYVRRTAIPQRTKIHVVVNWFEELKRLVPTN